MKAFILAALLMPSLAAAGDRIVKTRDGFILPDGSRAVKTGDGFNIHRKGGGTSIVRKTRDGFTVYDTEPVHSNWPSGTSSQSDK